MARQKVVRNKHNTPAIIKYPFWKMTMENKNATYACINKGEIYTPDEIKKQCICLDADINAVLEKLHNSILIKK